MNVRVISYWLLLFGSVCLLLSVSARQICAAQQNYPSHVTVFGQSSGETPAPQKVDPATEADIRQLMDLVGTKAIVTRMMTNMEDSMKPLLLNAFPPGQYRERLVQLFMEKFHTKVNADSLMDVSIPIYAQYLSDDEVKQLIQFFQTPLGQKWISVLPQVQAGVQPKARAWGERMGRESMMEVLQEHPDLAQQLKAATAQRQ